MHVNKPLIHQSVAFHGVAELREVEGETGLRLQRAPEAVRTALEEKAAARMLAPAGAEIRFVSAGAEVEITLSCPTTACEMVPFWGGFQGLERRVIGNEPVPIRMAYPERVRRLRDRAPGGSGFSPDVWRLTLRGVDKHGVCHFHDIRGDGLRPPSSGELPARTCLAYGTSVTEGFSPSAAHLSYVAQTARRLGMDHINLGCAGAGYCEPEMVEYIADRDDWDVAILELAINMIGAGYGVTEFRERATYMIERIAGTTPPRPLVCIVWYPYFADLCEGIEGLHQADIADAYRATYREVVAQTPHPHVHLVEGAELLTEIDGYTVDLAHPGDAGMTRIAQRLADRLARIMDPQQ